MMNFFKRTRTRYILHRHAIDHDLWQEVTENLAILKGLTAVERARLRESATLFLHEKKLIGVQELELTDAMCVLTAILACLPILGLGLDYLTGWTEVIIYPGVFRVSRDERDAAGVIHHQERTLSGESWARGPLIVSWDEIVRDLYEARSGRNVIIHEIAHKLDMLNGAADGYPPLQPSMSISAWSTSFNKAYEKLVSRIEHHHRPCINPYAAESPAEFFAVISEYFFCAPEILKREFADVYEQLRLYYRQDPFARLHEGPSSHN
jgi:hypothetical protein